MIRRLWSRLRYGPPCGAEPPWRLADAGPCIVGRRAHGERHHPHEWHADGRGFIWTDPPPHGTGRWQWNGPQVSVDYAGWAHLSGDPVTGTFTETAPE